MRKLSAKETDLANEIWRRQMKKPGANDAVVREYVEAIFYISLDAKITLCGCGCGNQICKKAT